MNNFSFKPDLDAVFRIKNSSNEVTVGKRSSRRISDYHVGIIKWLLVKTKTEQHNICRMFGISKQSVSSINGGVRRGKVPLATDDEVDSFIVFRKKE